MKKHFTVEIRKDCKWCGKPIKRKRYRTFCRAKCRNHSNSKKYYWKFREERIAYQRERSGKYAPNKKKCMICEKWYYKVGSHVVSRHGFKSARKYREEFNLPVKRGIVSLEKRKEYGDNAMQNGTVDNLKKGKKYRYKKDDPRAKKNLFYKGYNREPDEYYE